MLNPTILDSNNIEASPSDLDEAKDNKTLSLALMKPIFKKIGFFQLNLGLVYFLEYVCLTSYAERYIARLKHEYPERANEFALSHGYVIFSLCYQVGVFISRSSLSVVKIKRVEILTILQAINFIFFFCNT